MLQHGSCATEGCSPPLRRAAEAPLCGTGIASGRLRSARPAVVREGGTIDSDQTHSRELRHLLPTTVYLLRTSGFAGRGFLVLALLALFVVLARPICDLSHLQGAASHGDAPFVADYFGGEAPSHDDSEPCCTSIDDASLVGGTLAFAPDIKSFSAVPVAQSFSTTYLTRPSVRAAFPPDRPPLSRPYYARSARILI